MKFDDDLFSDELRRRLRVLLKTKSISMAQVSRYGGGHPDSLKEFLNGRKKSVKLSTFLAWARALDTPYNVIIDGIGFVHDNFDPYAESHILDETDSDQVELRFNAAKNLRFLRGISGHSAAEFAAATDCIKDGVPDVDLYNAFESGDKMIPPMIAIKLADKFGFSVEDIYALYGQKVSA